MWENLLVIGKGIKVTASNLIEEFQPIFSESQIQKQKEMDTYTYFCDFVHTLDMKGLFTA